MKCGDCGSTEYEPSSRIDVCVNCLALRIEIISMKYDAEEFEEVKRVLRRRNGTAKAVMERIIGNRNKSKP